MSRGPGMHEQHYNLLKYIGVCGGATKAEAEKAFPEIKDISKPLANMMWAAYLFPDDTTKPAVWRLTLKGKARVKEGFTPPKWVRPKREAAAPAPAPTAAPAPAPRAQLEPITPRGAPVAMVNRGTSYGSRANELRMSAPYRSMPEALPGYVPANTRPGANDFASRPSRRGDQLHYRDGRVTDLAGNPLPTNPEI